MRDIILNPSFHFTLLSIASLIGYFLFVFKVLIKSEKETNQLKKAADPKNWEEIPIKVIEKGFNIRYDYPNTYINTYPDIMSDEENSKAAAVEFEAYKERRKAYHAEKKNAGMTLEYVDAQGKTFNRISFTNNENINYNALLKENKSIAYKYIPNSKVVCYELLTSHEAELYYKKKIKHVITVAIIGFIPVAAILVTTMSMYKQN